MERPQSTGVRLTRSGESKMMERGRLYSTQAIALPKRPLRRRKPCWNRPLTVRDSCRDEE